MMISRMNSTYENINIKTNQNADAQNSGLQTKLMAQQRRLKAVDNDANMDEGQKTKEKLKIQQQIDELNRKMKMEELEKESSDGTGKIPVEEKKNPTEEKEKKVGTTDSGEKGIVKNQVETEEAQDVKESSKDQKAEEKNVLEKQLEQEEKAKEDKEKLSKENIGISPQEIHKMLKGDYELQKERVLGRVAEDKEATENVLRAEMKSDTIQGTDTEDKEEKLSQMRKQKPIQIEPVEPEKKNAVSKPNDGMKIVIREDSIV